MLSRAPVLVQAVKVNSLGKWKTALQMTSMSLLLFCKDGTGWLDTQLQGELQAAPVGCWCGCMEKMAHAKRARRRCCHCVC